MIHMFAPAICSARSPRGAAPEQDRALPSGEWTTYSDEEQS